MSAAPSPATRETHAQFTDRARRHVPAPGQGELRGQAAADDVRAIQAYVIRPAKETKPVEGAAAAP